MKIGAINSVSYSNRNNFKNSKANNTTSSIVSQNLITPSTNQLQNYLNIAFNGRIEVVKFIDPIEVKSNFSEKTSVNDIKNVFESEPDELEAFLLEVQKYPVLHIATDKQIEAFAEILGDRAPEVIEKALNILNGDCKKTALYGASGDKIRAIAKILGNRAPKVIAQAMTVERRLYNPGTALHYADADAIMAYKEVLGDNASEILANMLWITDEDGNTPLFFAGKDKIIALGKALGDLMPEAMEDVMTVQNKSYKGEQTVLYYTGEGKLEGFIEALGDDAPEVIAKILEIKDKYGRTLLHSGYNCTHIIDFLGKTAPGLLYKIMTMRVRSYENTALHYANAGTIRAYTKAFGDRAHVIMARAASIQNEKGKTALHGVGAYKMMALLEATSKDTFRTKKVLSIRDKDGKTALHYANVDEINAMTKALGDKAPEVMAYILPIQDLWGKTALDEANEDKINAIAEALGDKAPEVMAQAITRQNGHKKTLLHDAKADEVIAYKKALGNKAPEVMAKIVALQKWDGKTALHDAGAYKIMAIAEALGNKAPEVIVRAIAKQDKDGNTALHYANADAIRAYKKVFKNDTDKILKNILMIENKKHQLAIDPSCGICNYNKLEALIEVAPNATAEALKLKRGDITYSKIWEDILT